MLGWRFGEWQGLQMHMAWLCVCQLNSVTKPVSSTLWPLISANAYPQRPDTGIRFWRCSEPKLQCNYIHTLAQQWLCQQEQLLCQQLCPTASATDPTKDRHSLSWLSTDLLTKGKDPASPPKLHWSAIQYQGYSNTQPKLWSLSLGHPLPGRVLLDKRVSHRNQPKKALFISTIKDQEVGAEWWRAVVFHPHEAVVLDLKEQYYSQLGNLKEELITPIAGLTGTVLQA